MDKPNKGKKRQLQATSRVARLFDRGFLEPGTGFRTTDRTRYLVTGSGAFINPDKDRRTKKERRRDNRKGRGS